MPVGARCKSLKEFVMTVPRFSVQAHGVTEVVYIKKHGSCYTRIMTWAVSVLVKQSQEMPAVKRADLP